MLRKRPPRRDNCTRIVLTQITSESALSEAGAPRQEILQNQRLNSGGGRATEIQHSLAECGATSPCFATPLCMTMKAEDVTGTLTLARQASGCDQAHVVHTPRCYPTTAHPT